MPFTERAGLFTVLLLTGCTSPVVVTGPPSGSVVDNMLSRSAADISAMQYRVHQSGPSAKRPTSPAATRNTTTAGNRVAKVGTLSPVPAFNQSGPGINAFINRPGTAPTLRAAVVAIVPAGWKVTYDPSVKPDAPQLVRWNGNDRWPYVLNGVLGERRLKAVSDTKLRTVTVSPQQKAQAATGVVPAVPSSSATGPKSPFLGSSVATAAPVVPATAKTAVNVRPPVIVPKPVMKTWKIDKGVSLKDGFNEWLAKENCGPSPGKWKARWDTDTNYPNDYPLYFSAASLEDATAQLFALYKQAKVPLYVNGYVPQCLVVISDSK
ncbi:TcpQ domain-containing protein [Erwinia rhapontici]|uniref:TcpQ domain-containing protein n=1 Tax=Erwinia rhapontici TaxID=55212 RepID=UPI0013313BE1|nr:TcpQ domain-containing protein [Erwinia rhapontici]MBP2157384.1 type IV pili sensor histidine kinase/response regulator [Erwinia rhapontici]